MCMDFQPFFIMKKRSVVMVDILWKRNIQDNLYFFHVASRNLNAELTLMCFLCFDIFVCLNCVLMKFLTVRKSVRSAESSVTRQIPNQ